MDKVTLFYHSAYNHLTLLVKNMNIGRSIVSPLVARCYTGNSYIKIIRTGENKV